LGKTDKTTYDVLNDKCASSNVIYPKSNPDKSNLKMNTYSSIRDTPITISGFTTGILFTDVNTFLLTGLIALMPIAATVPRMTAIIVENKAIVNVVPSADKIRLSLNSSTYQSSVNPVQFARDLDLLNENTIKTAMGAYMKIRIRER